MALSKIDTTNMIEDVPQSKLDNNINFRNIIINGDMSIAQRGTSVTGLTSAGYKALDRYEIGAYNLTSAVYRIDQSTDAPTGFYNSLKLATTTANGSQNANEQFFIEQQIEAQNIYNLDFYTATADSVTISFHIKTNNTGTYPINLKLSDNNSTHDNTATRVYRTTYTVNSANTWEKKSITIQLDTSTSETRPTGNNFGMAVLFWFSVGSSRDGGTANVWQDNGNNSTAADNLNFLGNTSNEVYLTGVQIEKGTTASDFEFLPYDVNLRRCQRYYHRLYRKEDATADNGCSFGIYGIYYTNTNVFFSGSHPVAMRATPSLDMASGTNYYRLYRAGSLDQFDDFTLQTTNNRTNRYTWEANNTTDVSGTQGQTGIVRGDADTYVGFDAEL